jgi:hypothetical protein
MSTESNNEPLVPFSSAVPVAVKAKILSTAKSASRTPSYVASKVLEAWATGRPLPFRKRKAA